MCVKKNFKLFFDMDDTLANCSKGLTGDDLMECINSEGYFENLTPLPFLKEINKLAAIFPENIYIISACMENDHCKQEKITWLKKYLPFASKNNVIFTVVGEDKTVHAKEKVGEITPYCILIDDYSKNISDWEKAGGTAVKFQNKFNNTSGKDYKYTIRNFKDLMDVMTNVRLENEK